MKSIKSLTNFRCNTSGHRCTAIRLRSRFDFFFFLYYKMKLRDHLQVISSFIFYMWLKLHFLLNAQSEIQILNGLYHIPSSTGCLIVLQSKVNCHERTKDQQFYWIMVHSGFSRVGNLCFTNQFSNEWQWLTSTASDRKGAKIQYDISWLNPKKLFFKT